MKQYHVADLAEAVGGVVVGDPATQVNGVSTLAEAEPGMISFLGDAAYAKQLAQTRASAAVVGQNVTEAPCVLIQVPDPEMSFIKIVTMMADAKPRPAAGVHPTAYVSAQATLGEDVIVGPNAVVEDGAVIGAGTTLYGGAYIGHGSILGADCVIHANATIYHEVVLGARVIVHGGAVIGADGFGYKFDGSRHVKVPQIGTVEIGDDVEVGANTTIDRARMGKTIVGEGTKLDNLVQIAHNVKIGKHCVFAGFVGVSGSVTFGDKCTVAGQCGFKDHVKIGDGVLLYARTGVMNDLDGPGAYVGEPARSPKEVVRDIRNVKRIDDLRKTVKDLVNKVKRLENEATDA